MVPSMPSVDTETSFTTKENLPESPEKIAHFSVAALPFKDSSSNVTVASDSSLLNKQAKCLLLNLKKLF